MFIGSYFLSNQVEKVSLGPSRIPMWSQIDLLGSRKYLIPSHIYINVSIHFSKTKDQDKNDVENFFLFQICHCGYFAFPCFQSADP